MKKCRYCGKENKDTGRFCTGCGKSLEDAELLPDPAEWRETGPLPVSAPVPSPAAAQVPAPVRQAAAVQRTPAQEKLKKLAASPLALLICIAFTLMLLCSIYSAAALPALMVNQAGELMENLDEQTLTDLEDFLRDNFDVDVDVDLNDVTEAYREAISMAPLSGAMSMGTRLMSAVSSHALSILFAVALWIVFGVARQEESPCCGTSGLKILRVLRIIGMVAAAVLMAIVAIGVAFVIVLCVREGYDQYISAAIAAAVVLGIVFLLSLLFMGGVISTLKKLIGISENSGLKGSISGYAGFWLCVGGILSGLGSLGSIAAIFSMGPESGAMVLSGAARAVFCFAMGLFFFRSRKELRK